MTIKQKLEDVASGLLEKPTKKARKAAAVEAEDLAARAKWGRDKKAAEVAALLKKLGQ